MLYAGSHGVCSESTEYSDWEPDGINLQPPKRRSQRQIKRRRWSSLEGSDSSTDDNDTDHPGKVKRKPDSDDDEDDGEFGKRSSRKKISLRSQKKAAVRKQKKQVFIQFLIIFV